MAILVKLFVWNAACTPPGALVATWRIEADNSKVVAFDLRIVNSSGFVKLNEMPLNAWPFRGGPVTFCDNDAKGDVEVLNGWISRTEVRLPLFISTMAETSKSEIVGAQKVATPWGGVVSRVKNQKTIGRKCGGAPVLLQSGMTSAPN